MMSNIFDELRTRPEPFRNELAKFIYYRTYSRWIPGLKRREHWHETVQRYCEYLFSLAPGALSQREQEEIVLAIYDHEVAGSNRLLWSAGETVRKNPMTAYNCSAIAIDSLRAFAEVMFVLMSGTGVGVSVEERFIDELPIISCVNTHREYSINYFYEIEDSREGWATALYYGLTKWFKGDSVIFDYSKIRPSGSRLKTMGGRASGPEPLKKLLDFTRLVIMNAKGRKLKPIEVLDIINMIGDVVVSGGVRRSAEIVLFNHDDDEILMAKEGEFWSKTPWRSLSNNSAVFNTKPSEDDFWSHWYQLRVNGTGEPGIFNRNAWRITSLRRQDYDGMLTNPCGEISLRSRQTCNLSTVIARPNDNLFSLLRKVRLATIIGTLQSTISAFVYLSPEWKHNQEEERLLGVSITGIVDAELYYPDVLYRLKEEAIKTNKEFSAKIGINPSAAITCVKPEGTTGLYTDTSPGIHPRYSPFYIRRVRIAKTDPLFHMMRDNGIPFKPEIGQDFDTATTFVLEFAVKSPKESNFRSEVTALDQLKLYLNFKKHYTEHNPSCTIYLKDHEWENAGKFVWDNWDNIQGLSFLPYSNHVYSLAPYEEITEKQYEEFVKRFPLQIDYNLLAFYEQEDETQGAKEIACSGGQCELL